MCVVILKKQKQGKTDEACDNNIEDICKKLSDKISSCKKTNYEKFTFHSVF